MGHRRIITVALVGALGFVGPAYGQPNRSLEKCQKEVSNRLGKYLAAQQKAIASCLTKVAKEVIKSGDPVADAAKSCGSQLRKLENSAVPTKTLLAKTKAKVLKSCDPTFNASLAHSEAQVLDLVPPVVSEGIEAKHLDSWCTFFNHDPNDIPPYADGSLDSVEEWVDCAFAAADCNARQAIGSQYPRALEWLAELETALVALGPKFADAVTVAQELQASIDSIGSGGPTITCGPSVETCGDAIANGTDQCDGPDLDGATCASLGFKGGSLSCTLGCFYDFSGCIAGAFPATGQTILYKAGDDGDLERGAAFNLTNHGDGTITDHNSGLMWEVKDNAGGMHDRDNQVTWLNTMNTYIPQMNNTCDGNETTPCTQNSDCTGIGNELCGHAGYRDWRVPNRTELQTILNMGADTPAVPSAFQLDCIGACSIPGCSCTRATAVAKYWSSSTYHGGTVTAWYVDFGEGQTNFDPKVNTNFVRAVRAGGF